MIVNGTCLTMVKNDTEAINVTLNDQSGEAVNFAVGDIVYLTIAKVNPVTDSLEQVLQKSTEVSTVTNSVTIDIASADTDDMSADDEYKYDIQWSSSGGIKTIIPYSDFELIREVTNV